MELNFSWISSLKNQLISLLNLQEVFTFVKTNTHQLKHTLFSMFTSKTSDSDGHINQL